MKSNTNEQLVLPSPEQVAWADAELGIFFHFLLEVFNPDYSNQDHTPDAKTFAPAALDLDQWMEAGKLIGAKYAILVAKHGDGFCLWPTKAHDYSVKSAAWKNGKGDLVGEFISACKKHRLKPGLYYSVDNNWYLGWDHNGMRPGSKITQAQYFDIVNQQLTEIWTDYGELFEVWFDGGILAPEKGGPDLTSLLKKYQPKAMAFQGPPDYLNNIRWVGNEDGTAPYPCWATSYPGKNVNGTSEIKEYGGDPSGPLWIPGEADLTLRIPEGHGCWAWHPKQQDHIYSLEDMMTKYETSVGRNTNMLLGLVTDPRGRVPDPDMKRLAEFGAEIGRRYGHPLKSAKGSGGEIVIKLDKSAEIDRAVIQEDIVRGERVLEYQILGKQRDAWTALCTGTCVGHKRIERFAPAAVSEVKLIIGKSKADPRIKNFSIFEKL